MIVLVLLLMIFVALYFFLCFRLAKKEYDLKSMNVDEVIDIIADVSVKRKPTKIKNKAGASMLRGFFVGIGAHIFSWLTEIILGIKVRGGISINNFYNFVIIIIFATILLYAFAFLGWTIMKWGLKYKYKDKTAIKPF
jgi:hypothetical protein